MPARRRRPPPEASVSQRSASQSPSDLGCVAVGEFEALKDSVQSIIKRLDILERVFVFVDFDQIGKVLDKYSVLAPSAADASAQPTAAPASKVGIDRAIAVSGDWEDVPSSRLDVHRSIPEELGDDKKVAMAADQRPTTASREAWNPEAGCWRPTVGNGAEPFDGVDCNRKAGDCFTSVIDEDEQKSTCSTWDICSTRDGENDVDPELFQKFMTQALRPQWQHPAKRTAAQPGRDPSDQDVDSLIQAAQRASAARRRGGTSSSSRHQAVPE
eukprot:TRINITY_DN28189_c0_g1_i1.p1 TRINITY_DN28189_c0_g1~~TRINITY_DN28189_c0_g1_i1.p1  ORF type:complete len:288 (+),score=77.23 TRINITY_DN28189_c0_g1_i1:52-864(+)